MKPSREEMLEQAQRLVSKLAGEHVGARIVALLRELDELLLRLARDAPPAPPCDPAHLTLKAYREQVAAIAEEAKLDALTEAAGCGGPPTWAFVEECVHAKLVNHNWLLYFTESTFVLQHTSNEDAFLTHDSPGPRWPESAVDAVYHMAYFALREDVLDWIRDMPDYPYFLSKEDAAELAEEGLDGEETPEDIDEGEGEEEDEPWEE